MISPREQLESVALLFTYPRTEYPNVVEKAAACAGSAAPALLEFARQIATVSVNELQELYTTTFDLSPVCAPELGWHLFGEEYERGLFLARMRRELRAHGIPENGELPDHVSRALLLLSRMGPAKGEEFASVIVAPAVERMLKCMPARNLFACLLQAARQLIAAHFPAVLEPVLPQAEGAML